MKAECSGQKQGFNLVAPNVSQWLGESAREYSLIFEFDLFLDVVNGMLHLFPEQGLRSPDIQVALEGDSAHAIDRSALHDMRDPPSQEEP